MHVIVHGQSCVVRRPLVVHPCAEPPLHRTGLRMRVSARRGMHAEVHVAPIGLELRNKASLHECDSVKTACQCTHLQVHLCSSLSIVV